MSDSSVRPDQDLERSTRERLESCANSIEEATEALNLARRQRDEIVVDAVERGVSTRHVARWARLSQARVIGILAAS